ncbi:uncharacterized protein LOC130220432, partial [Danio aesculapii]|uniref:uncharacterized protein LOC130220432 n=1 Tax=Danio aesculapii TaxID=1142201 RepID=UPI0024C0204E
MSTNPGSTIVEPSTITESPTTETSAEPNTAFTETSANVPSTLEAHTATVSMSTNSGSTIVEASTITESPTTETSAEPNTAFPETSANVPSTLEAHTATVSMSTNPGSTIVEASTVTESPTTETSTEPNTAFPETSANVATSTEAHTATVSMSTSAGSTLAEPSTITESPTTETSAEPNTTFSETSANVPSTLEAHTATVSMSTSAGSTLVEASTTTESPTTETSTEPNTAFPETSANVPTSTEAHTATVSMSTNSGSTIVEASTVTESPTTETSTEPNTAFPETSANVPTSTEAHTATVSMSTSAGSTIVEASTVTESPTTETSAEPNTAFPETSANVPSTLEAHTATVSMSTNAGSTIVEASTVTESPTTETSTEPNTAFPETSANVATSTEAHTATVSMSTNAGSTLAEPSTTTESPTTETSAEPNTTFSETSANVPTSTEAHTATVSMSTNAGSTLAEPSTTTESPTTETSTEPNTAFPETSANVPNTLEAHTATVSMSTNAGSTIVEASTITESPTTETSTEPNTAFPETSANVPTSTEAHTATVSMSTNSGSTIVEASTVTESPTTETSTEPNTTFTETSANVPTSTEARTATVSMSTSAGSTLAEPSTITESPTTETSAEPNTALPETSADVPTSTETHTVILPISLETPISVASAQTITQSVATLSQPIGVSVTAKEATSAGAETSAELRTIIFSSPSETVTVTTEGPNPSGSATDEAAQVSHTNPTSLTSVWIPTAVSPGNAQCNATRSNETESCSLTTPSTNNQTLDRCNPIHLRNFSSLGVSSIENITDTFGTLATLTAENAQNVEFVQSWLCVKLIPILPFVSSDFIYNMSKINFSCVTFQEIVITLSEQGTQINETIQSSIYTQFIKPFLSRQHSDAACISNNISSADWLKENFGEFTNYATLKDLQTLNRDFYNFLISLPLLNPTQVAELTLSSGALNSTDKIGAVFDRLEKGNSFVNVEEFLMELNAASEILQISPTVSDVMMNRTFTIIEAKFEVFETHDWVVWFEENLIPILPSFSTQMLLKVTVTVNCTNYHVIVEGLGMAFEKMTSIRRQEIANVLVGHLKAAAAQFSTPGCRQNTESDAKWLDINLGQFSSLASYSDLKALNISVLAALESLSPDQKAELLLDRSTHALENVTVVQEVLTSILKSPDKNQLENFFQTFVEVSKEENITYIANVAVRETMLNLTLTALAPKLPLFETSDYALWFQINLVVLLASFNPSVLEVIPVNITCDSYQAMLKGMEAALADLPPQVGEQLKLSVDKLQKSPPEGCTPPTTPPSVSPTAVCEETLVDEKTLCAGVNSVQLQPSGSVSAPLCNFSLSEYACSSVASSLSSDNLNKLLTCKAATVMSNSTETWKLLFQKVAGVLENALSAYSSQNLSNGLPVSSVLDAIGEVTISNFSASELTNASFIAAWFQVRLTPFLPSVSVEFLSCLSTKNFSCDSYQAVVLALSHQASFMEAETKQDVFRAFIQPFLSRDDLTDAACLAKMTSSAEWLEKNFGQFSGYAAVEYLQRLNANFSSFESLSLLNPTQVAELTLSSGALNSTDKIGAVFDRLEKGNSFVNVEEFLMELNAASEILQISPTVSDVMMNRTFTIIEAKFEVFETHDWVVWFEENLIPILPSFSTQMLLKVTVTVNCTNYHVIVEGLGMAFEKMTSIRRQEIANVLVGHLKAAAAQFSTPGCRQNTESDAKWLDINLGQFSSLASYSDLKALNISVLAALESLSPDQKAELLLDRSTHALENVTVVQEVLTSILKSPDKNQLENFFQTFVEVSKEENITYIANVAVRETMLNLTLTALAPKLPLFETSDYALWFQINLVVLLASFNPSVLEVIPVNITCDSYQAMLKGMEAALADLPPQVGEQLKLSVDKLQKSPPEGCTPPTTPPSVSPTAVCEETLVDEKTLCAGVNSVQLQPSGSVSAPLCNFSLSEYACSSVASSLSSDNLNKLLTCKAATVMSNSTETWKLLFQKVAGVLENALSAYSSQNLSNGLPVSSVLDAIGEVTISNFSASELTNASFIAAWFQVRLTPFLPSVSVEFLSCLSTKNFSCDSYQAVVLALSHQASFMEAETKQDVFRAFIQPFLSRDDLTDAACLAKMTSSAEWLEKNFGQFSGYAAVEYLQRLNANFSSFESLSLLNPTQVAELTLSSGALNSTDKIGAVFDRLEKGNSFVNVEEFLMELNAASEILQISPTVSDVMMNRTFTIIEAKFEVFETHDWVVWFEENLIPILPSFSTQMLLKVTVTVNCTNYHVIVEGLGMAFEKMTSIRRQEIANVLVGHLKAAAAQFSTPGCRQNTESDAKWLDINLGQFSSLASYSDLKALNISVLAALESLSPDQKAELLLDRSTHALENVTVVQEVLTSILKSPDKNQLENFFQTFVEVSKEENITYIANVAVRETMLNLTLTALAPKLPLFETSDYALWFQINLVVLLASFNPSVLEVIPVNITCDSYQAMLKGMEAALADLPPQVGEQLKLSVDKLQKSPPEGCTPPTTPPSVSPTAVCEETLVDEKTLCAGVNSVQLQPSGSVSAPLCNFSLSEYACSSVASSLSSDNLNKLLTCKAATVMSNSTETWKLLFQKVAGVLENALSAYSSQNLSNGLPVSSVLDAIGEVTISNFSASELTNASFIAAWFQVRLTPFLPSVSVEFLSCLSTKNFSCDSYQAVVLALSHQASFMEAETKQDVFRAFIQPFLSRDDLTDAACLAKMTSSAEWLEKNFGQFSGYAAVEYLQRLNANFSSFESLSLLNPTQVAELTLSSGALNSTDKIGAVFDRLEKGNSFVNVEEFLMELNAASEILQISPTVSDVMMNRTFTIIEAKFEVFETHDWVVWFEENLIPILPSFSTQMLLKVTVTVNCTNYHVIVEGLGMAFEKMTSIRRQEIANVLVGHLKAAAAQFSTPGCRQNTESDAKWLDINLGQFSSLASYSDLKALNISVLAALESLSPDQKAELLLDRSTHALENVTVVQEVLTSILKSPDKNQLENFFQTFVEVSKEENITYIANVAVRETMLNLTLTALAPKLPLFETSDYALWFQINLVVLLASFNPSVLEVIPVNITCDSYQAMLKGMEAALADLPPQVGEQLKLSVDKLQKSPPEGCTPPTTPPSVSPTAVCEETLVDEKTLCAGVNSVQLQPSGSVSAPLCNFSLSEYACSSVASSLSSDNLNKLLTCKAATVMSNSTETWKLLFQKVAGVLENALSAYSSQNLSNGLPVSSVLDAIGEVTISNFSASELTNASFIAAWFQVRLTPFLPSVSVEFLSCLSTKNFSCDSYQAVVLALSHQASFMEAETKQDVFRAFIQPFLSRDDLTDAACLAKMTSSAEWLEKNFGQFSGYAAVEYLQRLNANFSSFESLSLLNPTQVAELTLSSGALNSTDKIGAVFDRLEKGNSFVNVEEFLMELNAASEILQISPTVSDVMMNRTFTIIEAKFEVFETHDWVVWFEENLIPILPSFSTQMLLKVTVTVNCTNYHVIVEGLGMAFEKMTSIRRQEIANVLVGHLKAAAAQFSTPGCRQNTESDAKWLDINLGQFSSLASYSDLKALNISVLAALESLSPDQKAELLLDRSTHALENVTVVQEVLTSILKSPDKNQLENFFQTFVEVSKEENITYIANVAVRETMLNLTLTALAPKLPLFETSDYALWFQINLVVLLASFNPSVLEVIPVNITCDSYQAMLKGMEAALADLP